MEYYLESFLPDRDRFRQYYHKGSCHFVKIICLIWGDYLKSPGKYQRTKGLSFVIAEQELLDK